MHSLISQPSLIWYRIQIVRLKAFKFLHLWIEYINWICLEIDNSLNSHNTTHKHQHLGNRGINNYAMYIARRNIHAHQTLTNIGMRCSLRSYVLMIFATACVLLLLSTALLWTAHSEEKGSVIDRGYRAGSLKYVSYSCTITINFL